MGSISSKKQLKKIQEAMDAGNIAWWQMILPSGEVTFSQRKTDMLGYKVEDFGLIDILGV